MAWHHRKTFLDFAGACAHCHAPCSRRYHHGSSPSQDGASPSLRLVLVGNPNVGKSVIFNQLTGLYVTVANYPGTTVEISRGFSRILGQDYEVIDTPGMYSLLPITEEERVARSYLLEERPDILLHVVDAKNLERMLPFTLQLLEAGLPVILVLNIMDEAEKLGISIDTAALSRRLGIPVVATVSTTGRGLDELRQVIAAQAASCPAAERPLTPTFSAPIEKAIGRIKELLQTEYPISRRGVALLLLQDDTEIHRLVEEKEKKRYGQIKKVIQETQAQLVEPLPYVITLERQQQARTLVQAVTRVSHQQFRPSWGERLSRLTMEPLTGIPILIMVLYYGLYKFVGGFGAGTLVDSIEGFFEVRLIPWVDTATRAVIPWPVWQELIVGEYGIFTLGVRYALAIILPIVGTFFLFFSLLEDSGYFPRLAMLVDGLFKRIGLNGRAVIPLVLGFGCDTMATVTTRILETKRERIIATLLLALAIPCSAQLGVILSLLSGHPGALAVWASVVLFIFLVVGYLAAQLLPGSRPSFYMELPPLRLPVLENVLAKTMARMKWYFLEVFPIFILASVLIWIGQLTGIFDLLIRGLTPLMRLIGLPSDAAVAFLFGFFRRDYGAAGLFDLSREGVLNGHQLTVAAVTLTLFIPCVAQFSVMLKERGWKTALAIAAVVFPLAFGVGYLVHLFLQWTGAVL